MTANMREKTGKPLGEWLKIVDRAKCAKHGEIVKHLKSEHGVTHGYANMIAHAALNRGVAVATGDDLVATQYSGAKADLRPIYDKLAKAVNKFGQDAQLAPKKAYVSLRRNKQFRADSTLDENANRRRPLPERRGTDRTAGSRRQFQLDGLAPRPFDVDHRG